jgi:peptidoglycan/LPS O-acetylase OafA/YrhL
MTLNNPGWSLSVEAFFYLCFPFLLAFVYRFGLKYLAFATVVFWLITQYILLTGINSPEYSVNSGLHDFVYYNPLMHLNAFLAGLFCGVLFKKNADKISSPKPIWLIGSIVLIIFLLESKPFFESLIGIKIAYTNGLIAPVFLLFIWLLASSKGRIAKSLSHPALVLLGEASFSLYILQKPVFGLYNKILEKRLGLGEVADFYVALILLIIISIASYKIFETPARTLINRKFN